MWYYECLQCGKIEKINEKGLRKLERNTLLKCPECGSQHLSYFTD